MTAPSAHAPESNSQLPPPGRRTPHRSLADGELATAWTLQDFFSNVNTVLRLPSRPKPKPEEAAEEREATGRQLPSLAEVRIPRGVIVAGAVAVVAVVVVRPLLSSMSTVETVPLERAHGVWMAEGGRYTGRMFELSQNTIAFRTSRDAPDYTWHKIDDYRTRTAGDSTLFTVLYEEEGKKAEFGFWMVPQRKDTLIRVVHQVNVVWKKTPLIPQRQ